jgi:tripartite-type tricarboxylate transporter receptor subunit TctC
MSIPLLDRRAMLMLGAATALGQRAVAQSDPPKLVRIVVGFPPGQATDTVARLMGERLHSVTGENYIVDNRPGQGGSLALGLLAKARNDGSVMMLAHMSAVATNPYLYKNVPYDSTKDFAPVGLVGDLPFVLVCDPKMPFTDLAGLIAYAKAHPDKLTNGSSGNGTVSHLAMEEFKRRADIKITHVPYKGSAPNLTDVMAGTVSMALETAAATTPQIQAGRLRALASATPKRLSNLPSLPTFIEEGFAGFNASTWLMVLYPAGTPDMIVQSTFIAIGTAMRTPDVEKVLLTLGALPRFSTSPAEANSYLQSEFRNWGDIVKRSGITLD